MIRDARGRTGGTFRLHPREIVANGEHAVVLVDWSAERDGGTLEGKEVHFHQDDEELDRRVWD